MGEKVFMQGNQALAESAIRAGCKLFFGYPITPTSEIPEYYARAMAERPEENITFIQGETETSVFNMIAGAVAAGHRAMTATSGPGFSLGQEAMSYMSAAGLPAVEVHLSDITQREEFRRHSVTSAACLKQIYGLGVGSYLEALRELKKILEH